MNHSYFVWNMISCLINGITSLALAIFVYKTNPKKNINIRFAFFGLSVAFWALSYFAWHFAANKTQGLFFARLLLIGAMFIPTTFLHFTMVFLGEEQKKKKIIYSSYAVSALFIFISFSRFVISGVSEKYCFTFWPDAGVGFYPFLLFFIFGILYPDYILFKHYKAESGTSKNQIKYILWGTFIGMVGGATNYFLYYNIPILPIGNILATVFVGSIAYAIVRHHLMDIEVIIKKTLVFTGLLASVFAMLVLPTLLIQEYILRTASFGGRMMGLVISGVIIILTMRRIEAFLTNITDKYLFQKKYDYKELLKTFTSEVLTVLELDKLVDLTVDKLMDIVKLDSCAVLMFDDENQRFTVEASQNIKDKSITLVKPDSIVTFMEETHGYILAKELRQKKIYIPDAVQEIIDKLNAELIIPMIVHEKIIGILSLGKKKSDEDYTQDDLDILLPLARTLAIAISNAKLFVELGKTQAEAAQREKMAVIGTLSAGINHEICNPLGIARGQCEAFLLNLRDGLYKAKTTEELLTKAQDIMAKVIKETDRATAITKKLSGFAKPSKGEAELVSIAKELDEVFGLVGYELKLEKIEFEKNIEENLPNIFVDRKQLQEVLFNLVRNAGQAIGDKGKITIAAHQENGKVFIDVQDTGSGIPQDKIKQLFNPFFTTKDPGKGTGLGLFIVRQVIEKNGGRIYLKETHVGAGTTFRIEFPAAVNQEAKAKE